ncbi:hypothetical protein I8920_15920 (plasmid) [Curtobacterium sp. YC1]|uniref:hypothetical protein n=1 Tax=Curtobacterium sp. YC1 TaxID=2795488 RepID=UPI0018E59918|nr:hypothetical protein [Curtobacterium sp. YC1]QQD77877.1 hypothetical protein I8920_15920 [Curtobacterium sp. YC1]
MQHIDTLTTFVPVVGEDEKQRQLRKLGEREDDIKGRTRMGYVLISSATIPGLQFTTFVDTFVRTDE